MLKLVSAYSLSLLLLIGGAWSLPLLAAEVTLRMPNGRLAQADFRAGEVGRPALLLLHGFLQTHHFPTIQSLADELSDAGYSVLAPTLTLGIDQRRESLPCDALQLHHLEEGEGELDAWVDWLREREYAAVVMVGHSSGGMRALLHSAERSLDGAREERLNGLLLISPGHFGGWEHPNATPTERDRARRLHAAGRRDLGRYHLSFCAGNYLAPPLAYLSYMEVDGERMSRALSTVAWPVAFILGGADRHLPPAWVERVAESGKQQRTIAGADHFFSGVHEFELHGEVLDALSGMVP